MAAKKKRRGLAGTTEEHADSAQMARNSRRVMVEMTDQSIKAGQCRTALKTLIGAERADQRADTHYMEAAPGRGEGYETMTATARFMEKLRDQFVSACLRPAVSGELRGLGSRRRRSRR